MSVWKFGDNVDTDAITPVEYIINNDPEEYAPHVMEPVRPDFADEAAKGDIVVAGKNFGSGSSRESAPDAFVKRGIECIISESFARIFYRNAINIGLPVYICPEGAEHIDENDNVVIDHDTGEIHNATKNECYQAESHPKFIQEILDFGGLQGYHEALREEQLSTTSDETQYTTKP